MQTLKKKGGEEKPPPPPLTSTLQNNELKSKLNFCSKHNEG